MISDVLKNKLLMELETYKSLLREKIPEIKSDQKYVIFPIFLTGVIDRIRFNMVEKRFDRLYVYIAKDGIIKCSVFPEDVVYCNETEIATIDLPRDF